MAVRREDELDEALQLEGGDDPHDRAERMSEVRLMLAALADEDAEVVTLLTARANGVSVEALAVEMEISPGRAQDAGHAGPQTAAGAARGDARRRRLVNRRPRYLGGRSTSLMVEDR